MKLKLTDEETAHVQAAVKAVLETGQPWEAPSLHHPAGAIIDAVLKIRGFKKRKDRSADCKDGFAVNGWQWDWWQYFTGPNGKHYTLSGSGHYGGHAFYRDEADTQPEGDDE